MGISTGMGVAYLIGGAIVAWMTTRPPMVLPVFGELATWQAIKPHVVHIHVKDSISKPSAKHPFSYVLPGEGEFAMAALRPVLAAEFTGCVSLEWEKLWHPYLAPLDNALTAAAKHNWW